MSKESSSGGGCSCIGLVMFVLIFWSIFFGLPVGAHKWNIDIFPPRIWDMNPPALMEVDLQPEKPTNAGN